MKCSTLIVLLGVVLAVSGTCQNGCNDDCTVLTMCSNDVPIHIRCSDQTNWKKQFCNAEEYICDDSPGFCTPKGRPGVHCDLRDGFYPDLLDCKKFYYCDHSKTQTIPYDCGGGTQFNPSTRKCEFNSTCVTFDETTGLCKGKVGKLVAHPQDKSLYILCLHPYLFQCVNDDHYVFDQESAACIFVCNNSGKFPDAEEISNGDLTYYYECVYSGSKLIKYHKQCPAGSIFDAPSSKCTPQI